MQGERGERKVKKGQPEPDTVFPWITCPNTLNHPYDTSPPPLHLIWSYLELGHYRLHSVFLSDETNIPSEKDITLHNNTGHQQCSALHFLHYGTAQ